MILQTIKKSTMKKTTTNKKLRQKKLDNIIKVGAPSEDSLFEVVMNGNRNQEQVPFEIWDDLISSHLQEGRYN